MTSRDESARVSRVGDVVSAIVSGVLSGTIALFGGGPFSANDELDQVLLAGRSRVTVVPTADAFERPAELIDRARVWGERLRVEVDPLMAITRPDASNSDLVAIAEGSEAVWLVGDSPIHLRTVMTNTPLWTAITGVVERGGVLAAIAGSAAALCDPMTDPRGGALTIGLGLVSPFAVFTETETWTPERLQRARQLAGDVAVAELPTGSAIVGRGDGASRVWETIGSVTLHGELPR